MQKLDAHSLFQLDALLPVYKALTDKPYFEPVPLNDLAPTDARDHYHFIQMSEELEVVIKGCTSMKAIHKTAVVHLEV